MAFKCVLRIVLSAFLVSTFPPAKSAYVCPPPSSLSPCVCIAYKDSSTTSELPKETVALMCTNQKLGDQRLSSILDVLLTTPNVSPVSLVHLSGNGLSHVPTQLPRFTKLDAVNLARNNISSIPRGAFKFREHLRWLLLHENQIAKIEAGAFKGNYGNESVIGIGLNNLRRFDSSVWQLILQQMASSDTDFISHIDLKENPIDCATELCHLAWLIRDNRYLLRHVWYGACSNGTDFESLNPNTICTMLELPSTQTTTTVVTTRETTTPKHTTANASAIMTASSLPSTGALFNVSLLPPVSLPSSIHVPLPVSTHSPPSVSIPASPPVSTSVSLPFSTPIPPPISIFVSVPGSTLASPPVSTSVPPPRIIPGIVGAPAIPKIPSIIGVAAIPIIPSIIGTFAIPNSPGIIGAPVIPNIPGAPSVPISPGIIDVPPIPVIPGVIDAPSVPIIPDVIGVPQPIPPSESNSKPDDSDPVTEKQPSSRVFSTPATVSSPSSTSTTECRTAPPTQNEPRYANTTPMPCSCSCSCSTGTVSSQHGGLTSSMRPMRPNSAAPIISSSTTPVPKNCLDSLLVSTRSELLIVFALFNGLTPSSEWNTSASPSTTSPRSTSKYFTSSASSTGSGQKSTTVEAPTSMTQCWTAPAATPPSEMFTSSTSTSCTCSCSCPVSCSTENIQPNLVPAAHHLIQRQHLPEVAYEANGNQMLELSSKTTVSMVVGFLLLGMVIGVTVFAYFHVVSKKKYVHYELARNEALIRNSLNQAA